MAFSPDPNPDIKETASQVATRCLEDESVGGLTHVDNTDKTEVHGILRLDTEVDNLPLDVTIVIFNSDGKSQYYYSRYMLNAVQGEGTTGGEDITADSEDGEGGDDGGDGSSGDGSSANSSRFVSVALVLTMSLCSFSMTIL